MRPAGRTLAADVSASSISPRAVRGLALIAVSLVALAAVIALRVRPGPGQPRVPPPAAEAQPDVASTMDWISAREGWLSAFDRRAGTSTLFHTVDAGRHWERLRVSRSLESPDFFDRSHGVVRSASAMFRTSDGGRHWEPLPLPPGAEAQQPVFTDADHGWVWDPSPAGLYATNDGGAHWRSLAAAGLPDTRNPPPRLLGFDGRQGWLSAGGALYATADGGESWAIQPLPQPPGGWTTGDRFAYGPLTVAADGRGQLLLSTAAAEWVTVTDDRGATWTATAALPVWPADLATSPTDGSMSWAWSAGELQLTRDAGAHWTRVPIPVAWSLVRVQAVDARTVWVAASVPDALGVARWTLFVSADAGITWIPAVTPSLA